MDLLLAQQCLCFLICYLGWSLEKEMATHSSNLAWKIPWTEEPGRLHSIGSQRVGHDWETLLTRLVIAFLPRSKRLLISWLQSPSALILEPKKIKSLTVSTVSPSICHEVMGPDAMTVGFWMLSFRSDFSLSSFTFIKRLFCSSLLSAIRMASSTYLRLLIFLLAILTPVCASSSPAFYMTYSAYKLNKQGDNIQPWRTPFPIWNQSIVSCPVLSAATWPAYRFLRKQVRFSGIPIFWRIFHSSLLSTQVSLVAQLVKNPPSIWETWVRSLGWEDPLEKRKATHSSILAWRIPWTV